VATDGTLEMTKKKGDGGHPKNWNAKPIIIQLRGSPEFKAWVEALAEFDATSVAELTERAYANYARQIGFTNPRPRR
jgi:hypothetical protein